jgi:hypothetical protein
MGAASIDLEKLESVGPVGVDVVPYREERVLPHPSSEYEFLKVPSPFREPDLVGSRAQISNMNFPLF